MESNQSNLLRNLSNKLSTYPQSLGKSSQSAHLFMDDK